MEHLPALALVAAIGIALAWWQRERPAVAVAPPAIAPRWPSAQALPTCIVTAEVDGVRQRMLVITPDGVAPQRELLPFEIIGVFDATACTDNPWGEGFRQNHDCMHFLNWVIALDGPTLPAARYAAQALGVGLLQMLDGRTADLAGEIPDEDILGTFEVHDGRIVERSWSTTFTHQAVTARGLFRLDPDLCACILRRLASHVAIERGRAGRG